jgi:hypothetical protein
MAVQWRGCLRNVYLGCYVTGLGTLKLESENHQDAPLCFSSRPHPNASL